MLNFHCIAHKAALAAGQAADEVPFLKKVKSYIQQLYVFYSNSAVRTAGLKEIQDIVADPMLTVKRTADTRWMSLDRAVIAVKKCMKSIIMSLGREASERTNATAVGLLKFITTYDFVAAVMMLADFLPILTRLSAIFQVRIIYYNIH